MGTSPRRRIEILSQIPDDVGDVDFYARPSNLPMAIAILTLRASVGLTGAGKDVHNALRGDAPTRV
jgi:hypothetical protein